MFLCDRKPRDRELKHLSIDSIISPRLYRSIDDDDDDDDDDARNKITTPTTLLSRPVRTCGRFHK